MVTNIKFIFNFLYRNHEVGPLGFEFLKNGIRASKTIEAISIKASE